MVHSEKEHSHVWVKVNAPVDSGVSGIVSALSLFPQLETVESCEGDSERGSWVCFRYGSYWKRPWYDLVNFVLGCLGPGIIGQVGDDAGVRIQMTPSGQVFGELSVRPGASQRVESALRLLARNPIVSRRRMSECSDGTSGT